MARKRNRQIRGNRQNILDCYDRSNEWVRQAGDMWYPNAHYTAIEVGELAGYTGDNALVVGAGMISATSPQRDWLLNVQDAKLIARGHEAPSQYGANQLKAEQIRDGEHPLSVLGGVKVVPFYLAIVDPRGENAIPVIDRHAGAVYLGNSMTDRQQRKLSNVAVNTRIVHAYRLIAEQLNLHVHQLQATTWVEWRIEKGYATL